MVTPAFAPWVDEDHSFLRESIGHIFQDAHGPACVDEDIQAVVAVVDKLPSPRGHIEGTSNQSSTIEDGLEGLSMLLVDKTRMTGETAKVPVGRSSQPSEPTMTYSVKSPTRKDGQSISQEVGFRLANTLFLNGNHRTIFASSWRHDRAQDDLVLKQKRDLSGCHITSTSEPQIELQVPLHPVTQRRKVLFSMGNILRQVSKTDGSDDPIPASTELEKELPRYVKENNLMEQRLAVWALIEPSIEPGSDANTSKDGDRISRSIHNGARLHRVVSGGGGWGKKQGLLSLDPEITFTGDCATQRTIEEILEDAPVNHSKNNDIAEDSFPPGFPNFGGESEITSINQVVKDGEFVQFFVAPEGEVMRSELGLSSNIGSALTCTFGAISTPDDNTPFTAPENESPHPGNSEESAELSPVISFKNYFGALSEKGITYSSSVSTETNSIGDSEGSTRETSRTKIGVPGARIRFV